MIKDKKSTVTDQSKTVQQPNNTGNSTTETASKASEQFCIEEAGKLLGSINQLCMVEELITLQAQTKDEAAGMYFLKHTLPKIVTALGDLRYSFEDVADQLMFIE